MPFGAFVDTVTHLGVKSQKNKRGVNMYFQAKLGKTWNRYSFKAANRICTKFGDCLCLNWSTNAKSLKTINDLLKTTFLAATFPFIQFLATTWSFTLIYLFADSKRKGDATFLWKIHGLSWWLLQARRSCSRRQCTRGDSYCMWDGRRTVD